MPSVILSLLILSTGALAGEGAASVIVKPHAVDLTFPAESVVEAVQQATVGSQVAGRILEVKVDAGQQVAKGELLMRIDAREAAEAARAADAQFANARLNYERTQSLVAKKFMSAAALDKAKADLDAAAASRAAAGASQSHASIVAPMAGVVARRHAEQGDMAMPGSPLVTVYQPGSLRVTASIPQSRLADIRKLRKARVEFSDLGQWVDAVSVQVLPTVDAATHATQVRVLLPTMPGAVPGMFARVHFIIGQADKLTVPLQALVRRGEVAAVYVQGTDNRVSLRQLRLGEVVGQGEIEVLAGLVAGDHVLLDPVRAAIQLKSGK